MPPPDRLYKYQSLTAYSLAALSNDTIWLAKPKTFNDPFDCAISLDRAKYKESVLHAVSDALTRAEPAGLKREHLMDIWPGDREAFEQYREGVRSLLQNMGVFCLSAVPDEMLMWSHYSNHHRGFCVEYDCSEGTRLRSLVHEVRYEDEVPSLSAADMTGPNRSESFDSLWLTKAKCWSYEKEWRVMMNEGDKSFTAPSRVLSVIFGARMPEPDRVLVARALRHQGDIEFKEAVLKDGQFVVEIVAT
jgi:hypothetical protein